MKYTAGILAMGVCLGLGMPSASADTDSFWTLQPKTVMRMEARILMPAEAKPITTYARYYEPGFNRGRRVVFGLLLEGRDRQVHIGPDHPIALDGGCSVVNVLYDVAADLVTSIKCNGA